MEWCTYDSIVGGDGGMVGAVLLGVDLSAKRLHGTFGGVTAEVLLGNGFSAGKSHKQA